MGRKKLSELTEEEKDIRLKKKFKKEISDLFYFGSSEEIEALFEKNFTPDVALIVQELFEYLRYQDQHNTEQIQLLRNEIEDLKDSLRRI